MGIVPAVLRKRSVPMRVVCVTSVLLFCLVLTVTGRTWAQSGQAGEDAQSADIENAVKQAAGAAKEALEAVPDPAQAATQASDEALGQGAPEKEEQFVYSISPWTGKEFGGTFAPEQVDTLYLMAGATSILNTQVTDVYFWSITGEYMADWFGKKEEVAGTLEILQNGTVVESLEKTEYSYYFPQGYGGGQSLLLGEEAVDTYEDYQQRIDAYYEDVSAFYEARRAWQETMDKILQEVRETGETKDPDEIPEAPTQPEPPQDFVYQPREAFAVNLSVGRYTIRLRDSEGNVVPESARSLDVFEARRDGIGYGVIPEHKWTRRFQSNDPSDIFYLDGKRIFYILPFDAKEFNFYKYVKMTNLHKPLEGEGTRSAWLWAQFDPVTSATLEVVRDGEVIDEIEYTPYYVQQTPGYALGYEIVEFDPESDPTLAGRSPTFSGYRVELEGDGSYQLRFVDDSGQTLPGSVRTIRSVNRPESSIYLIPLLPLFVGVIVFGWRRSKARRERGADTDAEKGSAAGGSA